LKLSAAAAASPRPAGSHSASLRSGRLTRHFEAFSCEKSPNSSLRSELLKTPELYPIGGGGRRRTVDLKIFSTKEIL